jgi:murein DD-endopeptidase MepM/ murein hydrolase activator NlpD
MNGMAMTQISIKASAIVLSAAALAACATPTYSARAGSPVSPMAPQYPISAPAAPAASPVPSSQTPAAPPAAATAETPAQPAPPAGQIQSQPLAPAGAPPQPTSPSAASPQPAEAPQPQSSPETYHPPTFSARPAPTRLLADGKVGPAKGMFRDYEVRKGDNLDAIARDLDTTRKVLVEANHLKAPYEITPGRHLKIPIEKAYVAESGDTLAVVAKRFDVSASELADLNNLPIHGRLAPGEKVALPANFHDQGPFRAPVETAQSAWPTRHAPPPSAYRAPVRSYSTPPANGGPYVPSPAAVAAGERARAYAAASANPPPAGAASYRPAPQNQEPAAPRVDVAAAGRGRFIWPVRGEIISPFGVMGVGRRNDGIDIKSAQGTVVQAAAAGEVVYAGNQVPGFGNLVLVKHADGWVTAYAHLDRVSVQMKQTIGQGQEIGQVGNTGGVPAPELHFEIRYAPSVTDKARPIDPLLVLPG